MQISCIDFSITILYVIFISTFLGWALFHPTRESRRFSAREEPLLNIGDNGEIKSVNLEENENGATKVGFTVIFSFCSFIFHFTLGIRFYLWFPFTPSCCLIFRMFGLITMLWILRPPPLTSPQGKKEKKIDSTIFLGKKLPILWVYDTSQILILITEDQVI